MSHNRVREQALFGLIVSGLLAVGGCADGVTPKGEGSAERSHGGHTKQVKTLGLPSEQDFGYVQAVKIGDMIFVAGQLSVDDQERVKGGIDMEAQMQQAYANVEKVLGLYGAKLTDVIEEVIFVTDMQTALAVAPKVRRAVYSEHPQVASTIVQVNRLAFPEALVEIKVTAKSEMPATESSQPSRGNKGMRGGGRSRGMGGGYPRY